MILGEPFEAKVFGASISVMMRAIIENPFDAQRIDEICSQTAESQSTPLLPLKTVADLLSLWGSKKSVSRGSPESQCRRDCCVTEISV